MRRLPPRRRPDFAKYLEKLNIDPGSDFTDFALLGASEAKLPGDGFSIVDPIDHTQTARQFVMEAADYRHLAVRPMVRPKDRVEFDLDPTNEKDTAAVKASVDGRLIGWSSATDTGFQRLAEKQSCVRLRGSDKRDG